MNTLYLHFESPQAFFRHHLTKFDDGGLFVAGSHRVKERERVMLQIEIASTLSTYCFQAGVANKAAEFGDGGRVLRGLELEFLTVDRPLIQAMLKELESSSQSVRERASDRRPIPMDAELTLDGKARRVPVLDFGPGGVFLGDLGSVAVGEQLLLRLVSAEHNLDQRAVVEVSWQGKKSGAAGVGANFVFASSSDRRAWNALYDRMTRSLRRSERSRLRGLFESAVEALT